METGGSSTIEIFIWILAAPAILILAAYGLVLWWRKKSENAVRQIGEQIQGYDQRLGQVIAFTQEYAGVNQEPFSEPLEALQKETSDLETELRQFVENCHNFEEQLHSPGANRLSDIINAPANGFRRWRRSGALKQEGEAIAGQLAEAEAHIATIVELPWELANKARQAEKDVAELVEFAQALQSKGARGQALQTILTQAPMLQRAINEIPREFLQADHEGLLAAANFDSTIRVFEALNRIRPAIDRYLPQAREWHNHHSKASADFVELKQSGANLRQSIAKSPEGLRAAPLQSRLDQVAQMAADLNQRLVQPEVDQLKPLAREISHLRRVIQDTEAQYNRAVRQVTELSQGVTEIEGSLDSLSSQYETLEHLENFPLAWDESRVLLTGLRQRLNDLGPAQQPRTPEELAQHLKESEAIRATYKPLAEKYPRVVEQHRALVALLDSPEIKDGAAWIRKSRDMLAEVEVYDPRNWPKQESVQTLPVELEELSRLHEQLAPADRRAPVKESEMGERLKETQRLVEQHRALRPRIEHVSDRLAKIKAMEEQAKQKLTDSYTALDRVALLSESNPLLEEIALSEIDRLIEEIRQLGNELNAQNQGEVEKKMQKIDAQAEKVNRVLNTCISRLNQAIYELGHQINDWLIQVDAVGMLEDAPVKEARALLAQEEYTGATQSVANRGANPGAVAQRGAAALKGAAARFTSADRKTVTNEMEAISEIKRKNDYWQSLLAAQAAVEEKLGPVLTAYNEMVQARNVAREALAEATQRLPGDRRAWPPSNQAPLTESQALKPVDEKWEAMKRQSTRIDVAILDLGRLTQQYRLVDERARQVTARVEQDQERVQDLEWQIGDLKQRWQTQAQADPNNDVIREGVQQLMSQADSQLAYIKHQYMKGALSYEQVIHNLQLLYDELFGARISIDDHNEIGLNADQRRMAQSNGRSK